MISQNEHPKFFLKSYFSLYLGSVLKKHTTLWNRKTTAVCVFDVVINQIV